MTIMHITRTVAKFSPRIVPTEDIVESPPILRLVGAKPKLRLVQDNKRSWSARTK